MAKAMPSGPVCQSLQRRPSLHDFPAAGAQPRGANHGFIQLEGTLQQAQCPANTPVAVRTTTSKTWSNPRKRPHHPDPGSLFEPINTDDALREDDNGKGLHASKRSRAAEWPLRNTDVTAQTSKQDERNEKRSSCTSIRPGKFLEGSMNDKVSQKPPSLYTKDEQAMEEYAKIQGHRQGEMDTDVDMTYDAGSEPHKSSGMFRFGRVIASAFKPFTAWQGMFKEKEKERSTSPEKNILQERQAKAAEAYAELKKSGYQGTQAYRGHERPVMKHEESVKPKAPFRDSGIDMDDDPSSAWTPHHQLLGSSDVLQAPPPPSQARPLSQVSDASSARKSSHHLRKPSLQGLKRVASQIHLSPVKKSSDIPPVPTIDITQPSETNILSPIPVSGLRREPSKKDVAKQYKLSKKVSDLENKLETARRELEHSISTAPPIPDLPSHLGRKPFKPGALSSLPSEGNLSPLKDAIVPPVPKLTGEPLGEILQHLPPKRSSARVTSDSQVFTSMRAGNDVAEVARPRTSRGIKTRHSTARTASESNLSTPPDKFEVPQTLQAEKGSMEVARPRTSRGIQAQTPTGMHKRLPQIPTKTPQNSPLMHSENMPPLPALTNAVASSHDTGPTPTASKVTDHASVVRAGSTPAAFLGRPSTTAPLRTRSKKSKQGTSPPPPSLASAKKAQTVSDGHARQMEEVKLSLSVTAKAMPLDAEASIKTKRGISPPPPSLASSKKLRILSDATATPTPASDLADSDNDVLGPLLVTPQHKLNGDPFKKLVAINDKPLFGPQKEDFEWPDDVF